MVIVRNIQMYKVGNKTNKTIFMRYRDKSQGTFYYIINNFKVKH